MMIPYADPTSPAENEFNKKCRCSVERAIGVWKSRFRCLCKQSDRTIQFYVETCCTIIAATAVLHNYCKDRNMYTVIDPHVQKGIVEERL